MFKINEMLLRKFGWHYHTFESNNIVYHIDDSNEKNNKFYFVILKVKVGKKSKYLDPYNEYSYELKNSKNKEIIEIKSNIELFSLIKKHNAWDRPDYIRHFKLSNILNKK